MTVDHDTADQAATPKKKRKAKSTAAAAASDDGASWTILMLLQLLFGHRLMIRSEEEGMLRLMAELCANFNFFALEVANKCVQIPTAIVKNLYLALHSKVLSVICANRSKEQLY
jgi:hypothetical protein